MATQMSDKETTEKCKMNPNVAAIRGRSNGTRAGSHWPEILVAVEDRNVRPAELVRLILMEMSLVCHELQTLSGHSSLEFKLKPLLAEVHALRTLAETTRHMTELAVQTDAADPDGPKVLYLLDTLSEIFKQSILDAGYTEHDCISIYKFFRASFALQESEIRRKMKEVADFPEDPEAPVWPKKPSNESAANSPEDAAAEGPAT
jgi:hypothetical protein